MPTQLSLRFDEVPVSCPVQRRYHTIAPCLAGNVSPTEQAQAVTLSYTTVSHWLRQLSCGRVARLVPICALPTRAYTPECVIVLLIYLKGARGFAAAHRESREREILEFELRDQLLEIFCEGIVVSLRRPYELFYAVRSAGYFQSLRRALIYVTHLND